MLVSDRYARFEAHSTYVIVPGNGRNGNTVSPVSHLHLQGTYVALLGVDNTVSETSQPRLAGSGAPRLS